MQNSEDDLVMLQILVIYSDDCQRKTKCILTWICDLGSAVTSSLHLLAMFQRVCCQQCVCKLYLTFLNVCFHNGSSYLCNTTFCRDVRPSNAVPFFLHACVVFCCNYRFWKLRTYFMLLWVSVGPLQVCFQFLFYILLSVLSDVILTLWEIRLTLYLESNLEFL